MLGAISIIALSAPLLPLADPAATHLEQRLLSPFAGGHLLGTDQLGRDVLSRLIWGTRTSLAVGLGAAFAAALIGSLIGLIAGFIVSVIAGYFIQRAYGLIFEYSWQWALVAAAIGLIGGVLGALYPAWRASNLDAVNALAYE